MISERSGLHMWKKKREKEIKSGLISSEIVSSSACDGGDPPD